MDLVTRMGRARLYATPRTSSEAFSVGAMSAIAMRIYTSVYEDEKAKIEPREEVEYGPFVLQVASKSHDIWHRYDLSTLFSYSKAYI